MPDNKRQNSKSKPESTASVRAAKKAPSTPKTAAGPAGPRKRQPRAAVAAPAQQTDGAALQPQAAGHPAGDAAARLSVLMVTPEAYPYAATGGLGEVSAGLAAALGRQGHRVTLVLPRYRGIDVAGALTEEAHLQLGDRAETVTFHTRPEREGVSTVFVDVPELFDREGLYGGADGADYPDNAYRFAVFSRAALEYARLRGERPSVIHAHDWHTGLLPVFQKMHLSSDSIVGGVPVIFTVHNLAFQGLFPASTLPTVGLGWEVMDVQALEYWGQISYLKGGINFSERITTTSPSYAEDILTPDFGFGLEGVLARRSEALSGILNDTWDGSAPEYVKVYRSAAAL